VAEAFFRKHETGVDLYVRLTPKASADRIERLEEVGDGRSHLVAKVRAVPEDGKANDALERLLSAQLGVAKGNVTVASGSKSRLKTVRIDGDAQALSGRLADLADLLRKNPA
jgi:uncharacterized protein (TIGR00251 family)